MFESEFEGCADAGHGCRTCIENVAGTLALICPGMKGQGLRQTFFGVFSLPACAPMYGAFERCYEARQGTAPCVAPMLIRRTAAGAAA